MRINNNITAMNSHRQYTINNNSISKSVEKLSSGFRINRAGDDAAGLAISEKMRAQIRGLNMASKNSQDAISLVQTAEGALQETHNILQRMRELAVQSASDTNEKTIDRGALQQEFQQLQAEIDDIATKTRFNDQNIIDGTFQKQKSSLNTDPAVTTAAMMAKVSGISVERAKADVYDFTVVATAAAQATVTPSTAGTGTFFAPASGAAGTGMEGATMTFEPVAGAANNGADFHFDVSGSETGVIVKMLDSGNNVVATANPIDATGWAAGSTNSIDFAGFGTLKLTLGAGKQITNAADYTALESFLEDNVSSKLTIDGGTDAAITPAVKGSVTLSVAGESVTLHAGDTSANFVKTGIAFSFNALTDASFTDDTAAFGAATFKVGVGVTEGKSLVIQTGANQFDELAINVDNMNTRTLGVTFSSISTREASSRAITEVNDAVNKVSSQRAALGALQNRLDHKIANLDTSAENLSAAESRIRDVDMAKQMTEFTKQNILAQASTAMLAQANALPQNVLSLLG